MIVQIYGPIVYRWMRGCGVQSADAADLMQDTFMAVAAALPRFEAQRSDSSFRGWLWTIARNQLRDRQRHQRVQPLIDGSEAVRQIDRAAVDEFLVSEPPSTADADTNLARLRALQCLRQSFDPRSWQMFWQSAIEEREPADVAAEMDVSRWAVYKARARVLQRLRQEMEGLE